MSRPVLLGIDAGGTFTDFVAIETVVGDEGAATVTDSLQVHKTLSTPAAPEQAILEGIAAMGLDERVRQGGVQLIHGSTVATNATLEGKVARTALVTNHGFGDLLTLARQTRPELYALEFEPIEPPVPADLCLEVGGRMGADGAVVEPLKKGEIDSLVSRLKRLAPEAVAINLLFSFVDARFEIALEEAIRRAGLALFVSRSSRVLPVYKEYERGMATWLNACLGPVVSGYINRLDRQLHGCSLQIMQSSGETIAAGKAADVAVRLLLSGPAGGLTAVRYLGRQIGVRRVISFDMGGTSTDVALLDGEIEITTEGRIGAYPVCVPMVDMHTIGAGGGSIAFIDPGGLLQVGPRSAGADPGPACYGKGGVEATVTDANLVLGRLLPEAVLAGGLRLDGALARAAVGKLAARIDLSVEDTALGIVRIANEHMARAIRMISVNRGHDPKQFLLASFGGAGGLHVCAIAEAMQMREAIVPVYGGVLSALGMVVADRGRRFTRTVGVDASAAGRKHLQRTLDELTDHGREQLVAEGLEAERLVVKHSADLRYRGQSWTLNVPYRNPQQAATEFNALHRKRYGYSLPDVVEIVNLCVNVAHRSEPLQLPHIPAGAKEGAIREVLVHDHAGPAVAVARSDMARNRQIAGPAIVTEYAATTFVAPGWVVRLDDHGNLLLSRSD